MPKPKVNNQHYVPRSYLKGFCSDNSPEKLFVFDKVEKKVFPTNVKNVASERFFYDFPQQNTQSENLQLMEQWYSELENRQARFLKHIQKK